MHALSSRGVRDVSTKDPSPFDTYENDRQIVSAK